MNLKDSVECVTILNNAADCSTICPIELVTGTNMNNKSFIVSDFGEELLILISFKNYVDLKSIQIYALSQDAHKQISGPKHIRIYLTNKPNIKYDELATMKPDKSICCSNKTLSNGHSINLQETATDAPQFTQTKHLAIYIESNQRNTQNTFINAVCFFGRDSTKKTKQTKDHTTAMRPIKDSRFEENKSHDVTDCPHLEKLVLIMRDYETGDAGISIYLDQSNVSRLLDDFYHLIFYHDSDEEFQFIYDQLGLCDITKCKIFERNAGRTMEGENESAISQIFGKVHCYYMHSFDVGYRFTISEKRIINADINNTLINGRVMKIVDVLSTKRNGYGNRLKNKFSQLSNITFEEKDTNYYSFGIEFKYGYINESSSKNSIPVTPKYAALKEELLINPISRLQPAQFKNEFQKATILLHSNYCKTNFSLFPIEYILALMIYCNYSWLQYEFSKTYRLDNGNKHSNFYWLARYLKMAVHQHGTKTKDCKVQQFYHGIGEELIFPNYVNKVCINGPLSTSSEITVAMNFATPANGLVVQFGASIGFNKTFSCFWLSDYTLEKEYLFIQNYYQCPLKIENIYNSKSGHEYKVVLEALEIIDKIVRYQNMPVIDDLMAAVLSDIIDEQLSISTLPWTDSGYGRKIIKTYFDNVTTVRIDFATLKQPKYIFINRILNKNQYLTIHKLNSLFPNLEHLEIHNLEKIINNHINIQIVLAHLQFSESKLKFVKLTFKSNENNISHKESYYETMFKEIGFKFSQTETCVIIQDQSYMEEIGYFFPLNSDPIYSDLSAYFQQNPCISQLVLTIYLYNATLVDIISSFLDHHITDNYFHSDKQEEFSQLFGPKYGTEIADFIFHYMKHRKSVKPKMRDKFAKTLIKNQQLDRYKLYTLERIDVANEFCFDDQIINLFSKLNPSIMSDKLKHFMLTKNHGYDWLVDDIASDKKSEILHIFGHELHSKLKSIINNKGQQTTIFQEYGKKLLGCNGDCGSDMSMFINHCIGQQSADSFQKFESAIRKAFWLPSFKMRLLLIDLMEKNRLTKVNDYQEIYNDLVDKNCRIKGNEWIQKFKILFCRFYNNNHIDILRELANASCKVTSESLMEEVDKFYKIEDEMFNINLQESIKYEIRMEAIKQTYEWKTMKKGNLELSDEEILSILLYCNGTQLAFEMRKSHQNDQTNTCQWKYLFSCLQSAIYKIYKALHYDNNEFYKKYIAGRNPTNNKLFHGLKNVSIKNNTLSTLSLNTVTSFSEDFGVANAYTLNNGMIFSINNAYREIYRGDVKAANVSWISNFTGEKEWILLPAEFASIHEIKRDNLHYSSYIRSSHTKIYEINIYDSVL
eukprot:361121_1